MLGRLPSQSPELPTFHLPRRRYRKLTSVTIEQYEFDIEYRESNRLFCPPSFRVFQKNPIEQIFQDEKDFLSYLKQERILEKFTIHLIWNTCMVKNNEINFDKIKP